MIGLELMMGGLLHLAAAGVSCQPHPIPQVVVSPSRSAVQYDNTKSKKELETFQIDTVNPYDRHQETHVGGLMSGEIKVEHAVGFVQEKYESVQQGCLHYDSITVKITINPTIYIASENRPGSCRYASILEHEKKHVEVDRLVVNKYAKRINKALSYALNKYGATFGPMKMSAMTGTQTRLQNYIDGIVRKEVDAMNAERKKLQQAVDTLEEYERVRKQCP